VISSSDADKIIECKCNAFIDIFTWLATESVLLSSKKNLKIALFGKLCIVANFENKIRNNKKVKF